MSDPGDSIEDFNQSILEISPGMKKSLNLTSDELKKLNLNYGQNEICFWVTTMYQGREQIVSNDIKFITFLAFFLNFLEFYLEKIFKEPVR